MKVFFSYAGRDRSVAQEVAEHLQRAGFDPWIAGDRVLPGDNYATAVSRALEEAEAMVVLVSPESMQSEHVRHEIGYAFGSPQYADRVIPVQIRSAPDVPWFLSTLMHIRWERDAGKISRQIIQALRKAPSHTTE